MRLAAALVGAVLTHATAFAAPCSSPDNLTRVTGGEECLIIRTYAGAKGAGPRVAYVLLHGNHTSGTPATSLYGVAAALAAKGAPNSVAIALIRPGYDDAEGNLSSGDSAGRADNFTAANVDIVASAVATLKASHKAGRIVLLGHSGGAAIAGVILGRHPGLADAALLAACPCDVPAWRFMRGRRDTWQSESAIRYADRIPARTRVAVLVGGNDDVTPAALSRDYVDAVRARGVAAELSVLDGIDHVNVMASPQLVAAALRLGGGD